MNRKASSVMTPNPTCCMPTDTVAEAARVMRDADVGPVPVVDDQETKRLVGMLTDRDIAVRVAAEGRDPNTTAVRDVMTTEVETVGPDDDVETAIEVMKRQQVRRVPVVNDSGMVVGIIAQADVARVASDEETGDVVEKISGP